MPDCTNWCTLATTTILIIVPNCALRMLKVEVIYSSIQVSNVLVLTVRFKLINFVFQIFLLFVPEMPASFTSYIVQIITIFRLDHVTTAI
jgi:hypothetical protein